MGWAENLQNASYKGVPFDVTKTRDQTGRDHAQYAYPHVDGADLKDLGRKPRRFSLTAFLWGDTYEYRLQTLTTALDEPGGGELIHPIFGSIPSVIVLDYDISHDAENPDSCTVDMIFLENRTGTALFATALPEMFGAALFDELDALTSSLGAFFEGITAPLKTVNSLVKRAKTVESTLINTLLIFNDDVMFTVDQVVALADRPGQFIQSLGEILENHVATVAGAVPALAGSVPSTIVGLSRSPREVAAPSTVISCWNEAVTDMDRLVVLPVSLVNGDETPVVSLPSDASVSDVRDVTAVYAVAAATELVSAATALLSDQSQTDVLTPDDIEKIIEDVRTRIQYAITLLRTRYEPVRERITETAAPVGIMWTELTDGLKNAGLKLQELGMLALSRRPPLTRKQVQADSCLRLLAHLWYADHSRAAELQRLNPQIRDPNAITRGMILNAYAR